MSLEDAMRYAIERLEQPYLYKSREQLLNEKIVELNERIKYLEEAILELEGKWKE